MTTFFLFGKYGSDAVKSISTDRTKQSRSLIEKLGGEIRDIYALLGEHDIVFITKFPNMTDAMKASIALGRLTGISFSTAYAIPIDELDKLANEMS